MITRLPRDHTTSFSIPFYSRDPNSHYRLTGFIPGSKILKGIHENRKKSLNGKKEKKKKKEKTKQPTGSAIPNQKAPDAFQSQLSVIPFRDPAASDSKDKGLGPTPIFGLFRKKQVFQFGDLHSTQKRIFWQERAIKPSAGNGAPTTQPGHRQRRQGTALPRSRRRPRSS